MSASGTSETNYGADQHFAGAPNWFPGKWAGNAAATRSQRFDCMFSAAMAAQPLRPSSQLGVRYTRGAGALRKGAEVGSEAAFSESAAEPSMAGVRA